MAIFWPNDRDRKLLQWVIDEVRNTSRNRPAVGGGPRPMQPTASSYVALVPDEGIPALVKGEQAGTGSGSGSGPSDDKPGHAECEIYHIVQGDDFATDQEHVLKKMGHKLTVYNLTSQKISAGWITVTQLKGGKWVAVVSNEGTIFVKPDQDVSAGILTAPDNIFSKWKGPAAAPDEDTGVDIEGDYAAQDFTTDDYCLAVDVGGKWYISCFIPGEG